jgi:hypothetical protein
MTGFLVAGHLATGHRIRRLHGAVISRVAILCQGKALRKGLDCGTEHEQLELRDFVGQHQTRLPFVCIELVSPYSRAFQRTDQGLFSALGYTTFDFELPALQRLSLSRKLGIAIASQLLVATS